MSPHPSSISSTHLSTRTVSSSSLRWPSAASRTARRIPTTLPRLDDLRIVEGAPLFLSLDDYDAEARSGTFDQEAFVDTGYPASTNLPADPRAVEFICTLEGATLEVALTVSELEVDRSGTASVQVVAVLDPVDVEACAD